MTIRLKQNFCEISIKVESKPYLFGRRQLNIIAIIRTKPFMRRDIFMINIFVVKNPSYYFNLAQVTGIFADPPYFFIF
jgi:hypothetical protein